MLEALRPKPFRGDVIAAGVVVLVTALWIVELRWDPTVATGVRLAYVGLAWAFVATMATLAEMERPAPRAYQSVLYLGSLALALPALVELARLLGARHDADGSGTVMWIAAALALHGAFFAIRRNSAACTLLAALAGGGALLAAIDWLVGLGTGGARWLLLAELLGFLLAAVAFRDRRYRHGVAFADAAGVAALALALTLQTTPLASIAHEPGWGWHLLVVAAGFGLLAYASVDREAGPAWLGVVTLALFVRSVGDGDSLVGWPLVLLVIAGVLLLVGLRPTTPLPPPPDADAPSADTLPLPER